MPDLVLRWIAQIEHGTGNRREERKRRQSARRKLIAEQCFVALAQSVTSAELTPATVMANGTAV